MKRKSLKYLIILSISLILFYTQSFNNFFFQDDFFNMKLAQEHNLIDAFNIFKKPIMDFYFYRPFSTQLYWSAGQSLFGFSPQGYHVISFAFFLIGIFLVYKLALRILADEKAALLTTFFYAYSGSHFYRLFFLSQFQELSFAVFTFATFILFLKKSAWTPVLFMLALTTKETAVMIVPFLFFIALFMKGPKKDYLKISFYCFGVLAFYLYARFFHFGFATGETYAYDLTPKNIINNYFWYSLWSLGLPESFVNLQIFKFPTIINPKVFTAFESWGKETLAFFILFMLTIFVPVIRRLLKFDWRILFAAALFIVFLVPVGFFPFHKFPYSLAVPLFGSSLILGHAISNLGKKGLILICASYLLLFFSAYQFNLSNHWARRKANNARAVFAYFQKNHPQKPEKDIYFRNNLDPVCPVFRGISSFSQEISYGIGDQAGLRLLYKNDDLHIYYEDVDKQKHLFSQKTLILDSREFFKLE